MIIKISRIINCSSEHPQYPATNLLEHPPKSSWRCLKPTEVIATVIFQLVEPSCITGLDIGNYRSCIVVVEASSSSEPDKWIPIINHRFLSHDEAINSKFRDQVQIFTKRELNPDVIKIKFDRVKATCMQSANPREVFGLEFIILRTEVTLDLGLDVFGRFKLKEKKEDELDDFKVKYLQLFGKNKNYKKDLKEKITEIGLNKFDKKQEKTSIPNKRPILQQLEADALDETKPGSSYSTVKKTNSNENSKTSTVVNRTLFGDVIPSPKAIKNVDCNTSNNLKKRMYSPKNSSQHNSSVTKKVLCSLCQLDSDELCSTCNMLPEPKVTVEGITKKVVKKPKPKKEFKKLFEDISFSLSGYANPQRDEIRRKALKMGAKYIADPNITNNKCTHLICAFKNTPKFQILKGHCKIIDHKFIEECFDTKKRIPWRRFALDSKERSQPESEEEIEGLMSPISTPSIYDQETDDSN
ncbi:DNA repair protein XRCC1 [Phymastichus coffea]|uniref:DNA repair protein XRCC1 n=1 Tax=Phymastichus coffea TaxID=108790 RepID=UPI00273BE699|nr:DNA repair protein XRCC1 [Phymastichus coffea]XP_058798360.1 DNA repair protein XRCC1 [Phymastichus coffea]